MDIKQKITERIAGYNELLLDSSEDAKKEWYLMIERLIEELEWVIDNIKEDRPADIEAAGFPQ